MGLFMSKLRFKTVLNKGKEGVPLHKLAKVAENTEKFLRSLGKDLGLDINKGKWIAHNFKNGSVMFNNEWYGEDPIPIFMEKTFNQALDNITSNDINKWNGNISKETYNLYTKTADALDIDESLQFGIYKNNNNRVVIRELTKQVSIELLHSIEDRIEYYGGIQGVTHSLFKGSPRPHFKIKDIIKGDLIDCFFDKSIYKKVISIFEKEDALIYVSGLITASRINRKIEAIIIDSENKIRVADEYLEGDLDKFFGCAPNLIGNKSPQDYIEEGRNRG